MPADEAHRRGAPDTERATPASNRPTALGLLLRVESGGTPTDQSDSFALPIRFGNQVCYFLKTRGGPLTPLALRSTLTSTRSAILMNGIPLFIPYSLRSKAMVPTIAPEPVPSPEAVSVSFSALVTPRIVKLPSTSKVLGPVGTTFVDLKVM